MAETVPWFSVNFGYEMGGPPPDAVEETIDAVSEILNTDPGWRAWWRTSGSADLVSLLRYVPAGDAAGEVWVGDATVQVELARDGTNIKRLTTAALHEEARSAIGQIIAVAQQNLRLRPHPALPTITEIEEEIRNIHDDD
ncbi:hypothetical protein AB0F72_41160 [Actinoplanes sp. NPDC023936]|uniref:hypothetical protein n=1 Tax=Actinoplanes sp. NPDC023936 TaxID=3154910 RepID=UPI0033FBC576